MSVFGNIWDKVLGRNILIPGGTAGNAVIIQDDGSLADGGIPPGGAGGGANISVQELPTGVAIISSSGSGDTIQGATDTLAGAMSPDDKAKLDSTGDVITHDASEFATAAQGAKADTASQPGDNLSDFVNDEGFTSSGDAGDAYAISHEADTTAHTAGHIVATPGGVRVTTDVQGQLDELDTAKEPVGTGATEAAAAVAAHESAPDPHTQYHTDARGDARYYLQGDVDTIVSAAVADKQDVLAEGPFEDGDKDLLDQLAGLIGGGSLIGFVVFSSSDVYPKNDNASYLFVAVMAGGGSGAAATSGNFAGAGGGGGASLKFIDNSTVGATETVTVGQGGGGKVPANNGVAGGTSSFGVHCSATGGGAGQIGGTGVNGSGGSGSGGDVNISGLAGTVAESNSVANTSSGGAGGLFAGVGAGSAGNIGSSSGGRDGKVLVWEFA